MEYPLKISARGPVIRTIAASAAGSEGLEEILGRFKTQIRVDNDAERWAVRELIRREHGAGSVNGMPKEMAGAIGRIFVALSLPAEYPEPTPEDEEMARQELERQAGMTIDELTEEAAMEAAQETIQRTADKALEDGTITEEHHRQVIAGGIGLTLAKEETAVINEEKAKKAEKRAEQNAEAAKSPKRKAADKAEKAAEPKKAKAKKEPAPKPTWLIETLAEDGSVATVLYEAITSKELLELTGVEKDTGKSRKQMSELQGAPVRMTHSRSGMQYTSKPSKVKEVPSEAAEQKPAKAKKAKGKKAETAAA